MIRQITIGVGVATALLVRAPAVGERDRRPDGDAIGLIRTVQSVQATHFAFVGYYETLQCLASATCLRQNGIATSNGWLVDPQIATLKDRHNHRLVFVPGRRSGNTLEFPSATPLQGYAMVVAGVKRVDGQIVSFCGDATGHIYWTAGDRVPAVREGRCLDTTRQIQ